jgi:hypothetical protein
VITIIHDGIEVNLGGLQELGVHSAGHLVDPWGGQGLGLNVVHAGLWLWWLRPHGWAAPMALQASILFVHVDLAIVVERVVVLCSTCVLWKWLRG